VQALTALVRGTRIVTVALLLRPFVVCAAVVRRTTSCFQKLRGWSVRESSNERQAGHG
jgi:hypothetical protein